MSNSVLDQNGKTLEIVEAGPVWIMTLLYSDVGVPTVRLGQVEADEEQVKEENIPIFPAEKPLTSSRKTSKPE